MKKIKLTQGKFALVDSTDYKFLNQFKWTYLSVGYAHRKVQRNNKIKTILMHRLIVGGAIVDHRDGNGLNNVRKNLRIATKSQNGYNRGKTRANSTGFKGVSHAHHLNTSKKFYARIKVNKKQIFLGYFLTAKEAFEVYKKAALKHHKEFAKW